MIDEMTQDFKNKVIKQSQKWLIESVIKHQFCPYAKQPHKDNKISYHVYTDSDVLTLLEQLAICCIALDGALKHSSEYIETTLFVIAQEEQGSAGYLADFHDYLDVCDVCNDFLIAPKKFSVHFSADFKNQYKKKMPKTWDEKYQLASFHPDYQFDGQDADDITNYTNRSPFPILHIIRNATIEQARLNDTIADKIVHNNITTLKGLSDNGIKALQLLSNPKESGDC